MASGIRGTAVCALALVAISGGCRTGAGVVPSSPATATDPAGGSAASTARAGGRVTYLCFSPDSRLLAVVQESAGSRPAGAAREWDLCVLRSDLSPVLDRSLARVAAPGVAWAPGRRGALWCVRREGNLCVFACVDGRTGSQVGASSTPFACGSNSPLSVSDGGTTVAVLAEAAEGKQRLVLWDTRDDRLTETRLPDGFLAAADLPPVISRRDSHVAVVSADRQQFIGLNLHTSAWAFPETAVQLGCPWHWRTWGDPGVRRDVSQHWKSGNDIKADRFLSDEKGLRLWAIRGVTWPTGGHVSADGQASDLPPDGELYVLDLDAGGAVTGKRDEEVYGRVWLEQALAISATPDLGKLALLYGWRTPPTPTKADCVGYALLRQEARFGDERVFLQDQSAVGEAGVSYAPDGSRVALMRVEGDGEALVTLSAADGGVLSSAALPLGE